MSSPLRSREQLAAFADRLLAATRPYASPEHALLTMPGEPGGYGRAVDGLEGFARTFLLAGFRLAGENGADPHGYLDFYARGLAAGTDPSSPERWVRPTEHGQAKVEAASLALVLDLTRDWLWDKLDPLVQEQVVDYLAEVVGDTTYPRNNWLWFRVVVETFLRSVSGPHDLGDITDDLARHDSYYSRDGWYRDGETRAYDHYVGWAMHLYPTLWARMDGAADLATPRAELDRSRLDRFLQDAVHLVGADGAPLVQGRSLVYRFAAAAPYWVGAMAQVPGVPLGQLRDSALGIISYFGEHGSPDDRGLLDLGWWGPWPRLAQSYSGTGSPYWASKGLLGLALPADHPVWSAPAGPVPHASHDAVLAVRAPVWAVSATAQDGIVRVSNHGTDHSDEGAGDGDSPLYARLGYSTATFPLLDDDGWRAPLDQSVVLVDAAGRRSHRSGMTALGVATATTGGTAAGSASADEASVTPDAVIAASRAAARWLAPDADQVHHGSGIQGLQQSAGTVTTVSVLRGIWEVRLVHLADAAEQACALEVGGWAVSHPAPLTVTPLAGGQRVTSPGLTSALVPLQGWTGSRVEHVRDASPLGEHSAVPLLSGPPQDGWSACALALAGAANPPLTEADVPAVAVDLLSSRALVAWADGATTQVDLPSPGSSARRGPHQ